MAHLVGHVSPVGWLKRHPTVADGLLAGALALLSIPVFMLGHRADADFEDPTALGFVLLLAQTLPLTWRRSHPLAVLSVVGVAAILYEASGFVGGAAAIGVLVALYTVAAHAERHEAKVAGAITLVGVTVALALTRSGTSYVDFASNYLIFATAWILGDNVRNRRARLAELEERATRLERERLLEAERAVSEERRRIARELHDVVAHSVSVMVVQAQAARRTLDRAPGQAREALEAIEQCGRQSLDELRRVVGVLRTDEQQVEVSPQPTVADIGPLVAQVADAGLRVDVRVEGEPAAVPSAVDLSAYRIVQEALTNAIKHAGRARAEVVLRYEPAALEVRVVDDGRGLASTPASGGGHGLVGMRERVALFGGSLHAGPRQGGGYEVIAHLPFDA